MNNQDIARIVGDLEKLGLRLSVTRRLDGSLRLDRWRTMSYWSNADEAERRWTEIVARDPAAVEEIAGFMEHPDAPSIVSEQSDNADRHDVIP